jgi:hypothetical protein
LLIIPLLYWCLDARLGLRAGLALLLSASLNSALKLALASPRPYWYSPEVAALAFEPTFGLPSGHAQNAVAVWGVLAAGIGRRWAWGLALLLMLLIGVSRVYLGVHFPTDVLAGWALGALVLYLFLRWAGPIERGASQWALRRQIVTVVISSLLMLAPSLLFVLALGAWELPAAWARNVQLAGAEAAPQPLALDTPVSAAGTWCGFALGALWLAARQPLGVAGPAWQRLARYLAGMAVLVAIWAGLGALLPDDATPAAYALRYARYLLVGAWIGAGAPALFQRVGLAQVRGSAVPAS